MARANESPRHNTNAFAWPMPPFFRAPLMSLLADFNGKLLESVAGAQEDWADSMPAVSRRMSPSHSSSSVVSRLLICRTSIAIICAKPWISIRSNRNARCKEANPRRKTWPTRRSPGHARAHGAPGIKGPAKGRVRWEWCGSQAAVRRRRQRLGLFCCAAAIARRLKRRTTGLARVRRGDEARAPADPHGNHRRVAALQQ
jgi:hypothetical protein